ncbi:MAG: YiiX/YebB-like N1pC/P60 family cysteine hydrolase [Hyphomicrobiaceae bacterium]
MLPETGCAAFDRDFARVYALATEPITSQEHLVTLLRELYRAVADVDLKSYDVDELQDNAVQVLRATYQLRLSLRSRLAEWREAGFLDEAAERGLRSVFRASRYATDMLGELAIGYDRMDTSDSVYRAFSGPDNNTLFHPEFLGLGHDIEFSSGDVVVVRGLRANSAAIARVGDVDSQFSHAFMIHVDEDGRQRALEALIEDGAVVSNLDYTLEHGIGRAVLFRHRDPDVAARAAQRVYDRILAARQGGQQIFYDFTMQLEDYSELFCSKLIREGFDRASGGLIMLPTHPTTFRDAPRDFLDRIGVTAEVSFAPGDMELETQFDAIAEWRDYRKTSDMRLMDLVMVKLFEWMEQKNYVFRPTAFIQALSHVGALTRQFPDGLKEWLTFAVPKIPPNMSVQTIAAIAMLHRTADPLYRQLRTMERKSIAESGRPLHPLDVYAHLDQVELNGSGQIGYLKLKK